MRVLMTGSAGFLGQGMIPAFADCQLRLFDVVETPGAGEKVVGSVANLQTCRDALTGMDAMVIAHMAPRGKGLYDSPAVPFEVNVTGTANLYTAARDLGIKRVVLISSIAVVKKHQDAKTFLTRDLPAASATHPYGLTKACQELIADQFYKVDGISSAILRPAYIADEATHRDKYGRPASEGNWQYIDRHDIGKAARLALDVPDLGCEVFYVLGHPDGINHADVAYTHKRLGWTPDHPFTNSK
jgi:nucleoside-diphosphate-sugar epimerase